MKKIATLLAGLLATASAAPAPYVKALEAGIAFSLTINLGFVLPHEIAISGDTIGLTFEAVEYI